MNCGGTFKWNPLDREQEKQRETPKKNLLKREGKVQNLQADEAVTVTRDRGRWRAIASVLCDVLGAREEKRKGEDKKAQCKRIRESQEKPGAEK